MRDAHAEDDLGEPRVVTPEPQLSDEEVAIECARGLLEALAENREREESVKADFATQNLYGGGPLKGQTEHREQILGIREERVRLTGELGASVISLARSKYGLEDPDKFMERNETLKQEWAQYNKSYINLMEATREPVEERVKLERQLWDLDENDPQYQVLEIELDEVTQRISAIREEIGGRPTRPLIHHRTNREEYLGSRREAYMSALQDIGVEFWDPNTDEGLQLERTTRGVANLIDETLTVMPASWIQASNERVGETGRSLRVWESKRRAHYSDHKVAERWRSKAIYHVTTTTPGPPGTKLHYAITKEIPPGVGDSDPLEPDEYYYQSLDWYVPLYHRFDYENNRPRGNGWREAEVNGETTWYRHERERVRGEDYVNAEITIPDADYHPDRAKSVLIHEFAHRTEISMREVGQSGVLFRESRTEGEEATHLGPGYRKDEVAKKDNFSVPYMGKEYPGNTFSEVVSMGLESLWTDSHGAFLGDSKDPEYEAQILGIIASTGQKVEG